MDTLPLPEIYRIAITQAAQRYFGFPAPVPVIIAQMRQESAFQPGAKSRVGAQGLFQFMPATAAWAAEQAGFQPAAPNDPNWSIKAAVWYDRWLYEHVTGATDCDKWALGLSGYNGGIGWVYKRQALSTRPGDWVTTAVINPGITQANQQENVDYVFNIIWRWQPEYRTFGSIICL
jgi:soluble lytic murein transglycosylase-like protein